MDFEMRLSGDGLDDLAVTSDELLEASAAVGGLVESVSVQHEETESSSDEAEHGSGGDFEAQTQLMPGDDNDVDDEEENEDNDGDADMDDDYVCTQVVDDDAMEDDDDDDDDDDEADAEEEAQGISVESVEEPEEDDGNEEQEEEEEPVATQPAASPKKAAPVVASPKKPSPVKRAAVATESQRASDDGESDASPLGKFSKVLGSVWDILERQGWQVAQGKDTLFCAMPGTQFFNFRPNINVFDSKDKACWKFIATSADVKDDAKQGSDEEDDSTKLWEILWGVAEKKFGWYTMECGPETWLVKPETRFEEFRPNETIFQTKKRAVLKCLELECVQVELGDSVDGHQVIDFARKQAAVAVVAKKEEPAQSTPVSKALAPVRTPSPALKRKEKKGPAAAAAVSAAVKASPSSTSTPAVATTSKGRSARATPPKSGTKTPAKSGKKVSRKGSKLGSANKRKGLKKGAAASVRAEEKPLQLVFNAPEFKCTFGIVYKELQARGWHHRPGRFEYDYFSPDYTPETAIRNGNYFQSTADFEEYIKDSGLWHKIESELRAEHDEMVEQMRIEARKRLQKQLERKKTLETLKKQRQVDEKSSAKVDAATLQQQEAKQKAQEAKLKAQEAREKIQGARAAREKVREAKERATLERIAAAKAAKDKQRKEELAATLSFSSEFLSEFKITMGKIVKKLVMRGWCYRPGRFEYDYFKPGVQAKDAVLNEDYFQSVAELETYLKTSGLWDEIARELREEHYAEQEREAMLLSKEENEAEKRSQQQKRKSPSHVTSSFLSAAAVARGSPKKARVVVESTTTMKDEPVAASTVTATSTTSSIATSSSSGTSTAASKAPAVVAQPQIAAEEVEELTNDIWANSHHFEFERR
ncbi:hypothetical protein Gpo141_00009214 [Globisporangium polare]